MKKLFSITSLNTVLLLCGSAAWPQQSLSLEPPSEEVHQSALDRLVAFHCDEHLLAPACQRLRSCNPQSVGKNTACAPQNVGFKKAQYLPVRIKGN